MPNRPGLIHPKLMDTLAASGLFPHSLTIQRRDLTQDTFGAPSQNWITVTGLELVPCTEASASKRPVSEIRDPDMTVEDIAMEIDLQGYYPSIDSSMRAVQEDGVIWDIRGITHDSLHFHTQLLAQRLLPAAVAGA